MGIRGASGPVGCSDPCLQERLDRARPIRGASGPVEFFDPSLRERVDRARPSRGAWARSGSPTPVSEILEAMARLEIHSPETFVAANVSHLGNAGWYCHG